LTIETAAGSIARRIRRHKDSRLARKSIDSETPRGDGLIVDLIPDNDAAPPSVGADTGEKLVPVVAFVDASLGPNRDLRRKNARS